MRTIRHYIDMRAEETPDKVYLFAPEPNLSLTYAQLKLDSIELGKYLYKKGLKKGDKISFLLGNGYQTTRIFLGTMYAGLVIAPLNLKSQLSQLEYVINHSDTRLIFFTADQKERLKKAVRNIDRTIALIQIDNDAQQLFAGDTDLTGITLPAIDASDDALLLYTSGTTGLPKGVILSHKNMIAGGEYTTLAHNLTPQDRALCSLPLYHINGEVVTAVTPLISGGSVVMPHKFGVTDFWELISEYRCTWFSVVPTIISFLTSSTDLEAKNYHLQQLRFGRSASSALPPSLHKTFEKKFKVPIIETMGLTETAAPVFSNPMDLSLRRYGSPGKAVGNKAKIIDPEGREVPRGVQGEIMIKGDNVMKCYYKAPDKTAEALEPDGWLHTGDLGYMDSDGFVFVTGRIKELIIKGGENISPREIDEALYKHPAVQDAAAVGIPDEDYGEEIMCCCVLKEDCECTVEDLEKFCREELGEFKTPKVIKVVEALPKGPSGKIQRLKLPDMLKQVEETQKEVKFAMRHISFDADKCVGCQVCQLVCSGTWQKVFNPLKAKLRIEPTIWYGEFKANVCRQRKDAKCVAACPTGALTVEAKKGVVAFDRKKCDGCQICVSACPYSAIFVHPEDKMIYKCDLCGGGTVQQCVQACPREALRVKEVRL